MSPRPYRLGKRQDQIDQSRRRVVDAARALLAEATSYTAFTVDAIARKADVARATVYYQFGSKTGLIEALCDNLAEAGGIAEVGGAFSHPDVGDALRDFIAAFGRFWAADRLVMRRLRALAALDPEVEAVIVARDERRRMGLGVLVGRMVKESPIRLTLDPDDAVRLLHAITSFETFDAIAGADRELIEVVPVVAGLAEAALSARGPER
jgi:AcrR family transcriptional regulator